MLQKFKKIFQILKYLSFKLINLFTYLVVHIIQISIAIIIEFSIIKIIKQRKLHRLFIKIVISISKNKSLSQKYTASFRVFINRAILYLKYLLLIKL